MSYVFGDYTLDPTGHELTGPEGSVHLEPQAFDVLAYLVEHRDRVVTKNELLDSVWGSRFVSESALTSRIKSVRSAVGDSGKAQHTVRTIHGKGYRFVAPVTEPDGPATPAAVPATAPASTAGDSDSQDDGPVDQQVAGPLRRFPKPPDQLRGRTTELDDLGPLIDSDPVVTLLGPGGTGKTRLCIELADRLPIDRQVIFVDLAAVRDDDAIGQALAAALRVEIGSHSDIVEACTSFLRAAPILLIIDNCEHVVDAAAKLVDRIAGEAPSTSILTTSRVPLGVRGETLYRLQPLPVLAPADGQTASDALDNPAVALFVDRVRKVQHDYRLDDSAVTNVLALCTALDGLPLALELAAGRMSTFGLDDLVRRLDRRLDLLGDDRTGTDDRHRSLRATLDWSYDLLDTQCQELFLHLSVFPAGHLLEGVEWLGQQLELAEPLLTLNRLVEASLIGRTETPSGVRYTQLETMRTLGVERLTEQNRCGAALDLAAEWAVHITAEMDQTLRSEREYHWDNRIRREVPNLREARNHLVDRQRWADLIQISVNLDEWARLRDVSELWQWCDELLDLDGLTTEQRSTVEALSAQAAWRRGRIQEAIELSRRALDHSPNDWVTAKALSALAVAHLFSGDLVEADKLWRQRAALDGYFIDLANAILCGAYAGDVDAAEVEMAEVLKQAHDAGWPQATSWAQYIFGEIQAAGGRPSAIDYLERAVDGAHRVGSAFTIGVAGLTLCTLTAADGDVVEAAGRYRDLIAHWLRSGGWTQQWTTLRHAAALLADTDPTLALTILSAADADPDAPGLDPGAREQNDQLQADLAAQLEVGQQAEAKMAVIDRGELAERTRASLADLMENIG